MQKDSASADEIASSHEQNLTDFEEVPEDKQYYLQLYAEVFETDSPGPDTAVKILTVEEKLAYAYEFMLEAKERGKSVSYDEFKIITQFSSIFDETGRSITNKNHYFHRHEDGAMKDLPFDAMIRDPVYKLLKYRGSFRAMITSSYFID